VSAKGNTVHLTLNEKITSIKNIRKIESEIAEENNKKQILINNFILFD